MTVVFGVVLMVLLGVGALVLVTVITARAARRRFGELEAEMGGPDVLRLAPSSLVARASAARERGRTLGMLRLTATELWFRPVAGTADLRVPRTAVVHAEVVESFLGKPQPRQLLRVMWSTPDGRSDGTDEAAWRVEDPAAWAEALTSRR